MSLARLLEFVANHWMLSLAFVVLLGALVGGEIRRRALGIQGLGPAQATLKVNHEDAVFVDIREDAEVKKSGLIHSAVHIPMGQLGKRVKELEKFRDRPVIVYCRSGSRSYGACATLKKQGFEQVYNLSGGISAWLGANLPVEKQ